MMNPESLHTKPSRYALKPRALALMLGLALGVAHVGAQASAGPNPETLKRLMQAKPSQEVVRLSPVREAALEASARALGAQTGLIEHAKEIEKEVSRRRVQMEKAFRFGDLVIGQGVLPPVLVHTKNAATVTEDSMRLAGSIYEIKQPARFFTGAPSWRDWLMMGLPVDAQLPEPPTNEQLLPRDANEKRFWDQKVKEAYYSGRAQAREIFEHNLSTLEQVYGGMRTYYDLYQRNMVSAPIIAKSQEIVTQEDENTIVVGDTFFRITMPAQFKTNPEAWRALEAPPSTQPLLPVGMGYDPEQVRHAYAVYQEQMEARQAQLDAAAQGKGSGKNKPTSTRSNATTGGGSAAANKPAEPQVGVVTMPTAVPAKAAPPAPKPVPAAPAKPAPKPAPKPAVRSAPAPAPAAAPAISAAMPLFVVPSSR